MELNKIHNIDCFVGMKKIQNNSIDLVVTDSPYGIDFKSGWSEEFAKIHNDDNLDFLFNFFKEIDRITKNDSAIYIYVGVQNIEYFLLEIKKYFKFRNLIVVPRTQKGGSGSLKQQFAPQNEFIIYATKGKKIFEETQILKPSDRYLRDKRIKNVPEWLYRLPDYWHWCRAGVYNNKRVHPTEKDLSSLETAILVSSKKDDVILDPFAGSGTTLMAAKKLGRKFLGFEIVKEYFDISIERLNKIKEIK